jgi:23S rRNA (adenine2503-C2)-methyltransferase
MSDLYSADLAELEVFLQAQAKPAAQARTYARLIWQRLYRDHVASLDQIDQLPQELRTQLQTTWPLDIPTKVASEISTDGSTRKDLLELADGARIETVLLRYRDRYTVCASTQVGCACGCHFCATGQMGWQRQLSAGEIVAQIEHYQRVLAGQGHRVANVVFMGMGEPLCNTEQTMRAVQTLLDPRGTAFAPGRVTLSTVGIVPGIRKLAELHERWPIKLAVSLHAATDALRERLMPINATYPLATLFEAIDAYTRQTQRHVFLEWVLIEGVNDTLEQAEALAGWLQHTPAHINLIQLNPTDYFLGRPSSPEAVDAFAAALDRFGIPHTMRQRRGGGISAGCGQLKATAKPARTSHA